MRQVSGDHFAIQASGAHPKGGAYARINVNFMVVARDLADALEAFRSVYPEADVHAINRVKTFGYDMRPPLFLTDNVELAYLEKP